LNAAQIGMRCGGKKAGSLTYSIQSDIGHRSTRKSVAARRKLRAGGCKKFASELRLGRQDSEVSMLLAEVPISRPSPPRPGDYVVVPGSRGPRRDFRISVGLGEGWHAEERVFDVSKAVALLAPGSSAASSPAGPPSPACFLAAEVTYAWPRDDSTVGSDREPVALFTGGAVHANLGHLSDAAIAAMLKELATELGAALGQERIYVAPAGPGFLTPESIAGDTWPGVLATLRSERTSGLRCRAARTWTP
jgi:hypothetical protein